MYTFLDGNLRIMMEETKREALAEVYGYDIDDLLFADGFDGAIIGIADGHDSGRVIYDYEKMIEVFMEREDATYSEAVEWVDFNTVGSYVGKQTPIYLRRIENYE